VTDTDLSVSGNTWYGQGDRAAYWKNGVFCLLEGTVDSTADAIFATENNVYVAGTYGGESKRRPVLWINGERQDLDNPGKTRPLIPSGIWTDDKDIIVVGREAGDKDSPTIRLFVWKNGVLTNPMPNLSTDKYDLEIQVVDGDIYIGGTKALNTRKDCELIAWKNGKPLPVPKTRFWQNIIYSIPFHVSNGDLYFFANIRKKINSLPVLLITKNDKEFEDGYLETDTHPNTLEPIPINISGLRTQGEDVIVFGNRMYPFAKSPSGTVWRNGKYAFKSKDHGLPGEKFIVKD